jgi:integrase
MLLSQALASYVRSRILRPRTQTSYAGHVKKFIDLVGDLEVDKISFKHVVAYREEALKHASPITFNTSRRHLISILNHCVELEFVEKNPFKQVKSAPIPKRPPKRVPLHLFQQVIKDIISCKGYSSERYGFWANPPFYWVTMLKLFYYTGMRMRQMVALRWCDFDFEKSIITLSYEGSKTHREWSIPLPSACTADLLDLRERSLKAEPNMRIGDRVFVLARFNPNCKSFTEKTAGYQISNFFKRVQAYTGVNVSAHKVRHTAASEMMSKTNNPKLVQEILGHSSLATTMLYVHPQMSEMRALVNDL